MTPSRLAGVWSDGATTAFALAVEIRRRAEICRGRRFAMRPTARFARDRTSRRRIALHGRATLPRLKNVERRAAAASQTVPEAVNKINEPLGQVAKTLSFDRMIARPMRTFSEDISVSIVFSSAKAWATMPRPTASRLG